MRISVVLTTALTASIVLLLVAVSCAAGEDPAGPSLEEDPQAYYPMLRKLTNAINRTVLSDFGGL